MAATLFDTTSVIKGSTPHDHRMRDPKKDYQWESHKGYDLLVKPGTRVYSVSDGEVIKMNPSSTRTGTIYGDRVTVKSADDYIYYTHIDSKVRKGQQVKIGDLIGVVVEWQSNPKQTHLHIASERKDVRNYVDFKTWAIVGGAGVLASAGSKENLSNSKKDNKDNEEQDKKEPLSPIDLLTKAYYDAVTGPFTLVGLPGLAENIQSNSNLDEEIERIKQLL